MAVSVTSILSVILGGLALAVHAARDQARSVTEATSQATAAIDRIKWMVSSAGVYQLPDQPPVLGLAVVPHQVGTVMLPDVLVVWSGGRSGNLAAEGVQERLPRVSELVIYAPDSSDARRLLEITVPSDSSEIDFRDTNFESRILSLIASRAADPVLICDRIRVSELDRQGKILTANGANAGSLVSSAAKAANVRFELTSTPDETALATAAPGTPEWYDLPWVQGIVSGDSGMRQATLRIELQIAHRPDASSARTDTAAVSTPFFGSVGYRYVYRP